MKIVHIITRLILGGAQENTLITCKLLAQRGHDVTLITGPAIGPEGELYEQAKTGGYETIILDDLRREINPVCDIPAYFKLKSLLKKLKPDIVHTHSAKAGILGRFAAWSLKGLNGNPAAPHVVHTIHGLAFHEYQNPLLNKFYIAVEKAAANRTDAFITVADTMTEKSRAAGIGLDKPYTTAYSAIEEDAYLTPPSREDIVAFRRKYTISNEATVIVKIARLFDLKGHDFVIESARRLAAKYDNCVWLGGPWKLSDIRKPRFIRRPHPPLQIYRSAAPRKNPAGHPRLGYPCPLLIARRPGPRPPSGHALRQARRQLRHRRRQRSRQQPNRLPGQARKHRPSHQRLR